MQEVAEIVGEVEIDALDQGIAREVAVLAEVDFAQQEVADGIGAEFIDEAVRVDDIALGFRHLVAVDDEPAMTVDLLRQRQVEGHEDARPDNRMEADDFLADEMKVCRPVFLELLGVVKEADWRQVVRQRVEPDVDDVLRVDGHRDAPVKRRARDAEVFEALLDEVDHLVAARCRLDEIRMLLDVLEHAVCILAHLEEIRFFRDFLHGTVTVRAAAVLIELMLRPVAFARRAVEALVRALVDVALGVDAAEDLLHDALMALLRRADEIIVADVEAFPEILEARNDLVDVFDWRHAGFFCLLLNLLAVLIRARQKKDIIADQAVKAGNGVRDGRAVRMADVELGARIINRRRDIKWFLFFHETSSSAAANGTPAHFVAPLL